MFCFQAPSKKKKKRINFDEAGFTPDGSSGSGQIHMVGEPLEKKSKKLQKLTVDQVEKDFKPHDYNKQGYQIFQGQFTDNTYGNRSNAVSGWILMRSLNWISTKSLMSAQHE